MKHLFVALLGVLTIISSCRTDDDNTGKDKPDPKPKATDYYPLKKGNYWVYEIRRIDSNGVDKGPMGKDSFSCTGDSIIGTDTFAVIQGNAFQKGNNFTSLVRDSTGYLVNSKGSILMSVVNFSDQLFEFNHMTTETVILMTETRKMHKLNSSITVPAGTFKDVINYEATFVLQDPKLDKISNWYPRASHEYYAKGIGLISEQFFYLGSPDIGQIKLVDYDVSN